MNNRLVIYDSSNERIRIGGGFITFRDGSNNISGSIYGHSNSDVTIATGNIDYMFRFSSNAFVPGWSGMDIGSTSNRWANIYGDYIQSYGNFRVDGNSTLIGNLTVSGSITGTSITATTAFYLPSSSSGGSCVNGQMRTNPSTGRTQVCQSNSWTNIWTD